MGKESGCNVLAKIWHIRGCCKSSPQYLIPLPVQAQPPCRRPTCQSSRASPYSPPAHSPCQQLPMPLQPPHQGPLCPSPSQWYLVSNANSTKHDNWSKKAMMRSGLNMYFEAPSSLSKVSFEHQGKSPKFFRLTLKYLFLATLVALHLTPVSK